MYKELIIMMGAPGSGKSTFVKKLMASEEMQNEDIVYISRDEIRFSMVSEDEEYFSKENAVYKEFIKQIDEALAANKTVIADQTSLNKKARAKLLNAITEKPQSITVVYMKRPLDVILKYNAKRTGREYVPEDAIINMYNSIQEPTADEGINGLLIIEHRQRTYKDFDLDKTTVDTNYREKPLNQKEEW